DVIDQGAHYFFSSLRLNIFSMRSVIRNPETILVVAAVMATKPSTLLMVVASSLLMIRIAPTTLMAEMALVSDISGVCSRGDTLRITSRPTKVASMKTYSPISRLEGIALPLHVWGRLAACGGLVTRLERRLPTGAQLDKLPHNGTLSGSHGTSPSISRTFGCTTSPPCVTIVSRTISSSRFSVSLPSLIRYLRKVAMFLAYIWLA